MKVYQAINNVQADLAKKGITKSRMNEQQGWSFRGIDDVYNALSPLLAEHGLCILPRYLSRQREDRPALEGGVLFCVTVEAEFDIVCAEDGSKHTARIYGEGMDSADKGTNKAMSAAYKYAAIQIFAIPTEGDNDADASSPCVASKPGAAKAPIPSQKMEQSRFPASVNPAQKEELRQWAIDESLDCLKQFVPGEWPPDVFEDHWIKTVRPEALEKLTTAELEIVQNAYNKIIEESVKEWDKKTGWRQNS